MLKRNYRVDLIVDLVRLFGPPILIFLAVVSFVVPRAVLVANFSRPLLYVLISVLYWTAKVQITQWRYRQEAKKLGAVCFPKLRGKWPGNLDIIYLAMRSLKEGYIADSEEFFGDGDTFNMGAFWTNIYVTRSPTFIQHALATEPDFFPMGEDQCTLLHGMFGNGILATDGAEAKVRRGIMRPFFAKQRVRDFDLLDRYAQKALALIHERAQSGQSIDVQDLFQRFTIDIAGEFLFDTTELNTLDLPLPLPGQVEPGTRGTLAEGPYGGTIHAIDRLQDISVLRSLKGKAWGLFEFLKDETKEHNGVVDRFILPLVAKALENKKKRGNQKIDIQDGKFIDHLADSMDNARLIRDELFNVLLASWDTSASTLTFVLYFLSIYPEAAAKLRDEVTRILPSGSPTLDSIRKMTYLRAILNETLRLFPPVPTIPKASRTACLVPGDHTTNGKPAYIPAGEETILLSVFALHRKKDVWGEDAELFVPERWIDKDGRHKVLNNSRAFYPFGAGPRACLGQEFAYNEASIMLIRILQICDTFTLRQEQDAPPGSCPPESWKGAPGRKGIEQVWPKTAITLFVKGGCWVQMGLACS
ncbi:cytochrome P450 monooxygenase CYP63 [Cantharellus anzutake]|uniref:cytochrome P450 monooxygenase CYP63 n=1 Tax=Cantharellus anzutake TaxID=1750568 RepID=UPI001902CE64|nr:cytochrome P450 monooxygenase CYP63 [Cantharellus anzutake]KAF8332801.1 cytochrome P450 monooxygenase CYP63 [Cantharellus anzutake]